MQFKWLTFAGCSLIIVSNLTVASAQNTLQDWPKIPQLSPNDPVSRDPSSKGELIFNQRETQGPTKFQEYQKWEILNTLPDVEGRFSFLRGFWDDTSNPARLTQVLSLKQIFKGKKSEIAYTSYSKALYNTPHFAPDGQSLLIRIGFPPDDRYNSIGLFYWKFNQEIYHYVTPAGDNSSHIYFPKINWSPGSRYLSYLRGGNAYGDYDQWTKPYRLFAYDYQSDKDREIAVNAGHHWSWTFHGTLLFAYLTAENATQVAFRSARPSIYEADTKGNKPQKLFDGGYFAQESPDGQWIAFCDWPGSLTDAANAPDELKKNAQRGLFLFHRPSKRRAFVGNLQLEVGQPPLLQWSPDGQNLFVLDAQRQGLMMRATLFKMEIGQQTLNKLAEFSFSGGPQSVKVGKPGFFNLRGTSPDGKYLYLETVEVTEVPETVPHTRRTLIAVNTQNGEQTPLARLTNRAGDRDWDWHDDSGTNPAFAAAQKIEAALPAIVAPTKAKR